MGDLLPLRAVIRESQPSITTAGELPTRAPSNDIITRACIECEEEFSFPREARYYTPLRCPPCHAVAMQELDRETAAKVRARRESLHAEWLQATSGIPEHYWLATLDAFDQKLQPEAFVRAREYAELLREKGAQGSPSMVLAGKSWGTGKSHLAAAIGHLLMEDRIEAMADATPVCPVLFTTANDMFLRIEATYKEKARESQADVLAHLRSVDLLIIDDVGKRRPTEHGRSVYYDLVNTRYNADRPIVMTSNLVIGQIREMEELMGPSTLSRLREMTDWVIMEGEDYRKRGRR